MPLFSETVPLRAACINLDAQPADILRQIRHWFTALGIDGQTLALEHLGGTYRVSCSEHSFVVYRTNSGAGGKHHLPGWPVCLVDRNNVFQEPTSKQLGQDHCACGLGLKEWLHMVEQHRVGSSGPNLAD